MSARLLPESTFDYSWLMACPDLKDGEIPKTVIHADDWVTFEAIDPAEIVP